ncbi:hypothetical protein COX64_02590 [Candidatus Dojkabacteria bacterium CG_4_10_14_0_2_um_filter_Dojkabacteria_WS6_41_15]|uniref:Uncharacterized protein n=1 Tax=Candidatus Dojkabacteria bacterium CG_4_10_14_0_2_um_filter_Dojkabacteria_WS6_41_15 TaxID=2014249 RepID=A0A2M7W1X9_9BACT|nr:MAG: hypothetical protein COX64_02590 [Candidatus Dojkabacteria bacterium CG_4_10_14_0_2_um_filter_Dojkabacteria_WS6_41_15]
MSTTRERIRTVLLLAVLIEYGILSLIVFQTRKVRADTFFPNGSISESALHFAIGIGYSLPTTETDEKALYSYEESLQGDNVSKLSQYTFPSLSTAVHGVYTRVPGSADNIKVPPGANIHVWWYPYNETGHIVAAKSSTLFLGQYQETTVADIINVPGVQYRNIVYLQGTNLLTKGGDSLSLGSRGNVQPIVQGGQAPLGKEIFVSQVINPIEVVSFSHTCTTSNEGKVAAQVSLELRNIGKLEESISIEEGAALNLLPGELKKFAGIEVAPGQKTTRIHVQHRVKRCLSFRKPITSEDPDTHALLVGRDDFERWTWGGIITEINSGNYGGNYCIERIPFVIEQKQETCQVHPKYVIEINETSWSVDTGKEFRLPFTVKNTGGLAQNSVELSVDVPKMWEEYITVPESIVEKTMLLDVVRHKFLPLVLSENESVEKELVISFPEVMPANVASSGAIMLRVDNVEKHQQVKFNVQTSDVVEHVRNICMSGKEYWEVAIKHTGNIIATEIKLPIRINGKPLQEYLIATNWKYGSGAMLIKDDATVIVSFPGNYENGLYLTYISLNKPVGSMFKITLTAGSKSAKLLDNCTIPNKNYSTISSRSTPDFAKKTTTREVDSLHNSVFSSLIPVVSNKVLGEKATTPKNSRAELGYSGVSQRLFKYFWIAMIMASVLLLTFLPKKRKRK